MYGCFVLEVKTKLGQGTNTSQYWFCYHFPSSAYSPQKPNFNTHCKDLTVSTFAPNLLERLSRNFQHRRLHVAHLKRGYEKSTTERSHTFSARLDKPEMQGPLYWENFIRKITLGVTKTVKLVLVKLIKPHFFVDFPKGDNNHWEHDKNTEVEYVECNQRTPTLQYKKAIYYSPKSWLCKRLTWQAIYTYWSKCKCIKHGKMG